MPTSNSGRDFFHDENAVHPPLYAGTIPTGKKAFRFLTGVLTICPPVNIDWARVWQKKLSKQP